MLRNAADRRTLVFVAGYYVALIAFWNLHPDGWAPRLGLVLGLCYLSFTCAVITHNTVHAPIFVSRTLNRWFQLALTMSYGHPVSAYVPGHNLSHHCHVQTPKDVMRTTKLRFRWNLLNQLLFTVVVGKAITQADISYAKAMRTKRPRWFRQWALEWTVFLVVTVTVLVLDWEKFLLYYFVPHMYAAWGIVGINFAQHDGCDENHAYNHSRNFVSPGLNWFLFNNGYHGIHHAKPGLHWSKLPAAHAAEVAPFNHPNLNQPSMFRYLWRSCIWPGKRLDYLGNPVVLPPVVEDESWIPGVHDTPAQVSLGAEA